MKYDIYYIIRQKVSVWKASVKLSIEFLPLVYMACSLCISLCSAVDGVTENGIKNENYLQNENRITTNCFGE